MRDCTLSNTHQLKNEKEDICCDGGLKKFGAMVAICIVSIDEMFDLFQSMPCHVDWPNLLHFYYVTFTDDYEDDNEDFDDGGGRSE